MSRLSNHLTSFRAGIELLRTVPEPEQSRSAANKRSGNERDRSLPSAIRTRSRKNSDSAIDPKPTSAVKTKRNKRSNSAPIDGEASERKKRRTEVSKKRKLEKTEASNSRSEAVASGSGEPSVPRKRKMASNLKPGYCSETKEGKSVRRIRRRKYDELTKKFGELAIFDLGEDGGTRSRSIVGGRNVDSGIAVSRFDANGQRDMFLYSYLRDSDVRGIGYPGDYLSERSNVVLRTNMNYDPRDGTIRILGSEREFFEASRIRVLPGFNAVNSCVARCFARLNRSNVADMFGLVDRPRSVNLVPYRRDGMSVAIIEYDTPEAVIRTLSLQRNARVNLSKVFLERYEDEEHWPLDFDTDSD